MTEKQLIPSYLETDFLSSKEKISNLMSKTDTFKDYNYTGANITMLIELASYIVDLTSFYTNQVAKNVYSDTSDVYEATHSLVKQRGYQPKGYISSNLDLTIKIQRFNDDNTIEYYTPGDQLYIPAWYPLDSKQKTPNNENIFYTTTDSYTLNVPLSGADSYYEFMIPLKQGIPFTNTYNGTDIIDGSIILPFKNIDNGLYPLENELISSIVYVNEEPWTKVDDFYNNLSGLGYNDKIYKLVYDKYKRYNIQFSSSRNMPDDLTRIRILLIESLGLNGKIGANLLHKDMGKDAVMSENVPSTITTLNKNWSINDTPFINNLSKNLIIPGKQIYYNNNSASINGTNPETIQELKNGALNVFNSQKRNVTKLDYTHDLEKRTDIIKANVWGEQEINVNNIYDYNKIYISIIPNDWTTYTIPISGETWIDPYVPDVNQEIQIPYEFNVNFQNEIKIYLEPKKILSTYEEFIIPDLVYFKFEIGILAKRAYNLNEIINDVKNKLAYYFNWENRSFQEIIDFKIITNYLINTNEISPTDNFKNIVGIQNLVFRDIALYSTKSNTSDHMKIWDFNTSGNFPMYTTNSLASRYVNVLRPIQLGLNQFPVLAKDMCIFTDEA